MSPSNPAGRAIEPVEFAIRIDFQPSSEDPTRVYRTMTGLIEACEFMDANFVQALRFEVRPILLLETIEAGSITTWLRTAVESVDEEALKSGDYKKIIGAYLVKSKAHVVHFLESRETVAKADEIYDLQAVIREAANQTGMASPEEPNVPIREVAESLKVISDATSPLHSTDRANYISSEGEASINTSFRVTADRIEEVLTEERIVNQVDMILQVKKPDFLGDSLWDFRYEGKKLQVRLADADWLRSFRAGEKSLRPGDALRGLVEVETRYGHEKEVIATHHKILKVEQIIRAVRQPSLDIYP